MTVTTVNSWEQLPGQGLQLWPVTEATEAIQALLEQQYRPYGYSRAILCTSTKTLHIYRQ